MSKLHALRAALPFVCCAAMPVDAGIIVGGGFEAPSLAGTGAGYCYARSVYPTTCVSLGLESVDGRFGAWQGDLSAAVATVGSAFALNGSAADGDQFAVLQGFSSWLNRFTVDTTGQYLLTWSDAGRAAPTAFYGGDHSYVVKLDGVTLDAHSTTSDQAFTPHSLSLTLTAGAHALRFSGAVASSDQSAYIDAVAIAAIPEPQTAMLVLAGVALAAGATRRLHRR